MNEPIVCQERPVIYGPPIEVSHTYESLLDQFSGEGDVVRPLVLRCQELEAKVLALTEALNLRQDAWAHQRAVNDELQEKYLDESRTTEHVDQQLADTSRRLKETADLLLQCYPIVWKALSRYHPLHPTDNKLLTALVDRFGK